MVKSHVKLMILIVDYARTCSHQRAAEYFRSAVGRPCKIWGHGITMLNFIQTLSGDDKTIGIRRGLVNLRGNCTITTCVPIGLFTAQSPLRGIKVATTNNLNCTRTDQSRPAQSALDFNIDIFFKWLFSLIPLFSYNTPPVPVLPPVPNTCFRVLDCFDMHPPWAVQKARPIPSPEGPKRQKVEAWFYSRYEMDKKYKMMLHPVVPSQQQVPFNSTRMTYLLIHGFYNSGNELETMKDALLNITDCNVIICNWGGGSVTLSYLQAAGNIRLVSRVFSNLLQFFVDHRGLNVTRVHIIGHSLGAHIAGLIGKSIPGIFQITALDPAQPLFQAADESVRITKSDASFVVAVHSDAPPFVPDLGFGMSKEVGHVDFYINGGFKQQKCNNEEVLMAPNLTNIIDLLKPVSQLFTHIVLCSHQSAVKIFTHAIAERSCIFWGQAVKMSNMIAASLRSQDDSITPVEYKAISDSKCTPSICSPLGLDTYFWPARGSFVVLTKNFSPYCIFQSHVATVQESKLKHNRALGGLPPTNVNKRKNIKITLWPINLKQLKLAPIYLITKYISEPFIKYTYLVRFVMTTLLPMQTTINYIKCFGTMCS